MEAVQKITVDDTHAEDWLAVVFDEVQYKQPPLVDVAPLGVDPVIRYTGPFKDQDGIEWYTMYVDEVGYQVRWIKKQKHWLVKTRTSMGTHEWVYKSLPKGDLSATWMAEYGMYYGEWREKYATCDLCGHITPRPVLVQMGDLMVCDTCEADQMAPVKDRKPRKLRLRVTTNTALWLYAIAVTVVLLIELF